MGLNFQASCVLIAVWLSLGGQDVGKPMAANADPGVEVATIKPSDPNTPGELFTIKGRHIVTINTDVSELIKFAYGLNPRQIEGGPAWLEKDKFDIDGVPDVPGEPNNTQMQAMVRKLLTDRFHLGFHREKREITAYVLTTVGPQTKLTKTERLPSDSTDFYGPRGVLNVRNMSMPDLAIALSRGLVDKPVVDETGLKGRYDFVLKWTPDGVQTDDPGAPPGFLTAMQEELGLKLRTAKAPVEVMVIERVEMPSGN